MRHFQSINNGSQIVTACKEKKKQTKKNIHHMVRNITYPTLKSLREPWILIPIHFLFKAQLTIIYNLNLLFSQLISGNISLIPVDLIKKKYSLCKATFVQPHIQEQQPIRSPVLPRLSSSTKTLLLFHNQIFLNNLQYTELLK